MNWEIYIPYFMAHEFNCKCMCGLNNMTVPHMSKLFSARLMAGIPFHIRSGSRCKLNNQLAGGEETSDHLTGQGSDIEALSGREKYIIITSLLAAGFTRIGVGPDYVHAGDAEHNPPEVIWPY